MNFIAFFLLAIGMVVLWIPGIRRFWVYAFFLAIIAAFFGGVLSVWGIAPIIAFWLAVFAQKNREHFGFDLLIFLLGVGLLAHLFPGIHNIKMLASFVVKDGCVPYTYYYNFDKGSMGLILLSSLFLCQNWGDWKEAFKSFFYFTIGAVLLLLVLATALGYVRFQPRCPSFTIAWIFHNLFLVAIAEEVFFRGFIQRRLHEYFRFKSGGFLALLITSILFGLAHFQGGVLYMILSFIAGLFYGGAYLFSGRIESAILTHFMLNFIHFMGFSYPALGHSG